ncbi:Tic22 family protein [Acaryochloris sp. IP29b_bin.148]|uniref:Tic22 family protein n=1 Tax=Acaryochloris sp. IP29b_bin.148 TaxID=2969218 RepID=UPI0026303B9D|nr:Tic22 family protein [Acaryochloris sp. IP29b_bin.148]
MKGLIRWGLIFSLAGGGFVSTSLVRQSAAIAIPEAEAVKRLENIPTFMVTGEQGEPLLAVVPNPKDKSKKLQLAPFYMSHTDAQNAVTNLKKQKPELGKSAKVTVFSLKGALEIAKQNKDKQNELVFQFIPTQEQIDFAMTILKESGQEVKQFNGVPMFFAVFGEEKEKKPLFIEKDKKSVMPVFFRQQDAQNMVNNFKKSDQKLGPTAAIQVTSLNNMLGFLLKADQTSVQQIEFVPDLDSLQYAVNQQKGSGTQPQQPSAAPEKPESK